MPAIDPGAAITIQPELLPGEFLVWAGRPVEGIILHRQDLYLIPLSLFWGGFSLLWEAGVSGLLIPLQQIDTAGILWGIPFVLLGQYLMWGRFLHAAWKKQRTFYGLTNRRVIIVQNGRTVTAHIDRLPAIMVERGWGAGTIRFPQPGRRFRRHGKNIWDSMAVGPAPAFIDVEDAEGVSWMIAGMQ
ncbi:MAG TPA: hypothetical protein VHC90_25175 [Bryobacteraceae bacterium]|nr:hypothetical protein [Bryobacteraceae bacterium]